MRRKAETLEDFDRDLRAFNCMDRIPEIKVGKYFYSDIRFNTIGSDVVAFYSGALNRKVEKLEKENQQLKEQIEKLNEEKQYETCPYRSTDMGCDYCDYRDRYLKYEVTND